MSTQTLPSRSWWMRPRVIVAVVACALTTFIWFTNGEIERSLREAKEIDPWFLYSLFYRPSGCTKSEVVNVWHWTIVERCEIFPHYEGFPPKVVYVGFRKSPFPGFGWLLLVVRLVEYPISQALVAVVLLYSSIIAAWLLIVRLLEGEWAAGTKRSPGIGLLSLTLGLASVIFLFCGWVLLQIADALGPLMAKLCLTCGAYAAAIAPLLLSYDVYKSGQHALEEAKHAKTEAIVTDPDKESQQ
jgi:hypothetical protein